MKIQSEVSSGTATFVLVLLLAVYFLAVTDRAAAQSSVVSCQSSGESLSSTTNDQRPKIAAPSDNAALQDERTSSTTVQGVVIDGRTRQPIAGGRVTLERGRVPADLNARSKEPSVSVLTNERGRFRLERVEPGVYRLMAAKRGYLSSSFRVVELESGKTTTRELRLDPLTKLSGRVLDESTHPVKDAKVAVLLNFWRASIALPRLLSEQGNSVLMTTAERQGEFELFIPAEEERVTLVALALGYAPSRLGPLSPRASQARTGIRLRLSRGLEARGRVVDEDGTPIQSATVLAHSLEVVLKAFPRPRTSDRGG